MAKATLITIGDEILIGQIIDTNGAWIGQQLTDLGLDINLKLSVGDSFKEIVRGLQWAAEKSQLVIVTGGLGPTRDDVTKSAIGDFFGVDTYFDEENFQWITELFTKYGREPRESHRQQCYLPTGCTKIENKMGTAPGMHMVKDGVDYFFTPGVPLEMKYIFRNGILPWLREHYDLPPIFYKTIHTAGQGESVIADEIEDITENVPENIKIAFLPGMHQVRIRVLSQHMSEDVAWPLINRIVEDIAGALGDIVYGYDGDSLQDAIGRLLKQQGRTITLAESCTGGYISHQLTTVPGSSEYFIGSVVSYTNRLKMSELGVSAKTLEQHGAVSEETVLEMAQGARKRYKADVALAVSGIAGPDGGTEDKPVGTVWMCVSDANRSYTRCFLLNKSRVLNIQHSGAIGLNLIRKFLLGSDLA